MTLYNVTFNHDGHKDLMMPQVAHTGRHARMNVARFISMITGLKPTSVKSNAVVFGVDGKGKSLNKLKKKK